MQVQGIPAAEAGDGVYRWLIRGPAGAGDPFDRHVFACAIAAVLASPCRSLPAGLGLPPDWAGLLLATHFPHAARLLAGERRDDGPAAPEEPDLRDLLIEHRSRGTTEELWLAHVVARRSLGANHLWQDMGLTCRADLSQLMRRHFRRLAERNDRDMKWKKFFYRELCRREGVVVCKSPNCDICSDFAHCFGEEKGDSPVVAPAGSPGPRHEEWGDRHAYRHHQ
jgi:nitrogen fixation protein NifQ